MKPQVYTDEHRKRASLQKEFSVIYRANEAGIYDANLAVEDKVIIEVKAVEKTDDVHRVQLLN